MKFFLILSTFLPLVCCVNKTVPSTELFPNRLPLDSLVNVFTKKTRPFKLVSPGIHDGVFYALLSIDDDYSYGRPNQIVVVDLKKKEIHQLVENPAFWNTEFPLLDFYSDTLFLLSSYESLLYTNSGKSWEKIPLDTPTWHFMSMAKMKDQLILSKSVYGINFFNNKGITTKKIYNNPILLHYFSAFSIPLNDHLLYGSSRIGQNLIELVSSEGWKIQLATRAAQFEDNFYLYKINDKYIVVLDTRIITLDAVTGKILNELDFSSDRITFHQLVADKLFFFHHDGSKQFLYQLDVNKNIIIFLGQTSPTASHFINHSDSYYSFERDGVYEIRAADSLPALLRKGIKNIYAAEKLVDVSTGDTYFLDDFTLYW